MTKQYAQNTIIIIIFSVLANQSTSINNLFCNSDFQNYGVGNPFRYFNYVYQNGAYLPDKCWFLQGSTLNFFLIQRILDIPNYTNMVNLMQGPSQRILICQNANLEVGKIYNYTFQIALLPGMANVTGYSYVNYEFVKAYTAPASIFPNLASVTYIFKADRVANTFCAIGDQQWISPNDPRIGFLAIEFDNFFLLKIPSQYEIKVNEIQHSIDIISIQPLPIEFIEDMKNYTIISIGNKILNTKSNIKDNILIFSFSYNQYVDLKLLRFNMTKKLLGHIAYQAQIIFNGLKTIYYPLSPSQIQNIENMKNLCLKLYSSFFYLLNQAKNIGCSYFLANFITFYSLITLYNFLNFSTQPVFSYTIMNHLSAFLFENDDAIINFLDQKIFNKNGNISTFFSHILSYSRTQIIPKQINSYSWFGQYGVSPNYFANNCGIFSVFMSLLLKMLIVFVISRFLPKPIKKYFNNKFLYIQVFIVQCIINSTTMSISAMSVLLHSGVVTVYEKVNYFLQMVTLAIIISMPSVYYVVQRKKNYQKIKKIEQEQKKQINTTRNIHINRNERKQKKKLKQLKFFWETIFTTIVFLLRVLVPILVTVGNKIGTIIIITIYYFILLICIFKGWKHFPIYKRIYRVVLLFVFGLHHFCFLFFTVLSVLSDKGFIVNVQIAYLCHICGFIVIVTVICGGLTEIIHFLVEIFFEYIFMGIKKLINWIKTKKKKTDFKEQNHRIMIPVEQISQSQTPVWKTTGHIQNQISKQVKKCQIRKNTNILKIKTQR